jgi:hypothetical protein
VTDVDKIEDKEPSAIERDCVVHTHPVPPSELGRYYVDSDPHSERDIANYVEWQARDEIVQHVEKIKREIVVRDVYEIWDVTTDKDRWWVITNMTNLYSQKHFPSLDYTLSFHIGLMMRLRSRSEGVDSSNPSPLDEVLRRADHAQNTHDAAVEAEDYQSVGMLLRENLISLIAALRRRTKIPDDVEKPQDSNFIGWSEVLMNQLCGGGGNKDLRQHLKNTAKETWQLVNWLTHARNVDKTASSVAIHATQTIIGNLFQILERNFVSSIEQCPICKSRKIRSHFDISIPPDGEYYASCGVCDWNSHPGVTDEKPELD